MDGVGWDERMGKREEGKKVKMAARKFYDDFVYLFSKRRKKTKQNKTKNQETLNNLMQTSFRVYHKLGFKIDSLNK